MKTNQLKTIAEVIRDAEMLLIGIGSGLERTDANAAVVDRVYGQAAELIQGKNSFVITENTDGKLLDGTIPKPLTAASRMEGQELQEKIYLQWLGLTLRHKLVILELEEGFLNPAKMRWPFERITMLNKQAVLIRVGAEFAQIPAELSECAYSVPETAEVFLTELLACMENSSTPKKETESI